MSASPSPPNPGAPKRPPPTPSASTLRRAAPGLLAGGTALTLLYTYFSTRSAPVPNPLRTPGVKNIEGAYRGGGATATHTPAYGGTKQGERDGDSFRGDGDGGALGRAGPPQGKSAGKREFNVGGPNEGLGVGDGSGGGESRDMGEVQRPAYGQSGPVGKLWNRVKYDNEDSK